MEKYEKHKTPEEIHEEEFSHIHTDTNESGENPEKIATASKMARMMVLATSLAVGSWLAMSGINQGVKNFNDKITDSMGEAISTASEILSDRVTTSIIVGKKNIHVPSTKTATYNGKTTTVIIVPERHITQVDILLNGKVETINVSKEKIDEYSIGDKVALTYSVTGPGPNPSILKEAHITGRLDSDTSPSVNLE